MKYYSFEYISAKYSQISGNENEVKKIRDKFVTILELVGIDKSLFKTKSKTKAIGEDGNEKILKSGSYIFPESCCEFAVRLLEKYTTSDFKRLREANYDKAGLSEKQFLVDWLTFMLKELGVPDEEVNIQRRKMDQRLQYRLELYLERIGGLVSAVDKFFSRIKISSNYEDVIMLANYMAYRLSNTADTVREIWSCYQDIRSEEICNLAVLKAPSVDLELEHKRYVLECELNKNEEYQHIWKSIFELISEEGYVKDKTSRFNRLRQQLNIISTEEQQRLFGESLPEVDLVFDSPVKHPLVILREAVEYNESYRQDIIKKKEEEAAKSEEDRQTETELKKKMLEKAKELSEKYGHSYPPPREVSIEQRVFIEGKNIGIDLEGSLLLSCCNQYRIYFERGAKGRTILACPQCHRYVVVDYSKKTSELLDTIKYSKYLNDT